MNAPVCSAPPEPEVRKRTGVDIAAPQPPTDPSDQPDGLVGSKEEEASKAPPKPQRQYEIERQKLTQAAEQAGDSSPKGTWTPLLANVCLCTALALGAYVCYRACFH